MKKPIHFTDLELEALYEIIKGYQENSFEGNEYHGYDDQIDSKMIKSIQKKITNSLPKEIKEEIDKDLLRERYHTYNNQIDEKVYSALKNALQKQKTVEIRYFNMESAEFIKREVDVYYTSAKYIIGYCYLRKAIRKFRTSRIASAKLTDKAYKIPKNFDKKDY